MGSCFSSSEPSPALKTSAISSQIGQDSTLPLNSYMNKMHEITTQEEFDKIMNDKENMNVLIVCDFHAIWCPPCLRIAPTLHKWALNDYKTNVIFMKIDVDKNSDLSNLFSVSVLPTFVFFKDAKEIYRSTGGDSSSLKQEIDKFK